MPLPEPSPNPPPPPEDGAGSQELAQPALRAAVLSTGDEVLTGQSSTRTRLLARRAGWAASASRNRPSRDRRRQSRGARGRCSASFSTTVNIIVCTGGLGPTVDDLTSGIAARRPRLAASSSIRTRSSSWKAFGQQPRSRDARDNRKQAMVPELSEVLDNPAGGTAPGLHRAASGAPLFFFMPGVPREMKKYVRREGGAADRGAACGARGLLGPGASMLGLAESAVDPGLTGLEAFPGVKLGFRAHFPDIRVKLTVKGVGRRSRRAGCSTPLTPRFAAASARIFLRGPAHEGGGGRGAAARRSATLATAESCTGGSSRR